MKAWTYRRYLQVVLAAVAGFAAIDAGERDLLRLKGIVPAEIPVTKAMLASIEISLAAYLTSKMKGRTARPKSVRNFRETLGV